MSTMISESTSKGRPAIRVPGLLRFAPYLLFAITVFLFFAETPDDAYITLRYAANLVAGHGLVFNPGERVEGFTSPLHVLISAGLLKAAPGLDALFVAKILSLVFGVLIIAAAGTLAQRMGLRPTEAVFAQCLLAANSNFAIAAVNGLETTLYAFLVLATVITYLKELKSRSGIVSSVLLGVAAWARPDAITIFVGLLIVRYLWAKRKGAPITSTMVWALPFVVLTGLLIVIRLSYYGLPLPNTYYAKTVSLSYGVGHGAFYLLRTLWPTAIGPDRTVTYPPSKVTEILTLFWAVVFWVPVMLGCLRSRYLNAGLVCGAVCLMQALFILRTGGDWMIGWRFVIPILPFLAVLQCYGIRYLAKRLKTPTRSSATVSTSLARALLGLWMITTAMAPHTSWAHVNFTTDGSRMLSSSGGSESRTGGLIVEAGRYIHDEVPPGATVAWSEMGYDTFINPGVRFFDVRGLTNHVLAMQPGKYKQRIGFVDRSWRKTSSPQNKVLANIHPDYVMVIVPVGSATPDLMLGDQRYRCVKVMTDYYSETKRRLSITVFRPAGETSGIVQL